MYEADGMSPEHARRAAADVMRRPEEALAVHARAELGVDPDSLASPWRAAASSLVCFLFGALLPVLPWLWSAWGRLRRSPPSSSPSSPPPPSAR